MQEKPPREKALWYNDQEMCSWVGSLLQGGDEVIAVPVREREGTTMYTAAQGWVGGGHSHTGLGGGHGLTGLGGGHDGLPTWWYDACA